MTCAGIHLNLLLSLLFTVALTFQRPEGIHCWFRFGYGYDEFKKVMGTEDALKTRNQAFTKLRHHQNVGEATYWNISYRFKLLADRESDIFINFKIMNKQIEFFPMAISPKDATMGTHDVMSTAGIWIWWMSRKKAETNLKDAIASRIADIRTYFNEYELYASLEKCDILQANEDFIQAITRGDTNRLEALCTRNPHSVCSMADYRMVSDGYEEVIENWRRMLVVPFTGASVFSNGTNLKYHGDVATISCSVEPLVCKERYAYHDGGRYNSVNIFTRNLSSGRFEVLCHVGSKFFREFSKEAIQLRNIYKDPTRSLSHRSTRNRGNVMSVGPDLFGKLLVRTGNLNPLGLESEEGFTSGDAANRRLEIGHDYGEEGVYTSRNELELPTSSTNYEEEDTIIDQQKLKPILPMVTVYISFFPNTFVFFPIYPVII